MASAASPRHVALTTVDFCWRARTVYSARIGVVDEPGVPGGLGRLTYCELLSRCDGMIEALDRMQIGPGERVAVISPNAAKLLIALYAVTGRCPVVAGLIGCPGAPPEAVAVPLPILAFLQEAGTLDWPSTFAGLHFGKYLDIWTTCFGKYSFVVGATFGCLPSEVPTSRMPSYESGAGLAAVALPFFLALTV